MPNTEAPKFLDPKLDDERRLLFRYLHSYLESHNDICWQIQECNLLLKNHCHDDYNTWKLNDSLYKYAEASIGALFWICGDEKKHPFAHHFLRLWRNKYHHDSKVDLQLYDFVFTVEGKSSELKNDYFISPNVNFNESLKNLVKDLFKGENVVTDATIAGLIKNHHVYMLGVFGNKEVELANKMPGQFLIHGHIKKRLRMGETYTRFVSDDDFWSQII